MADPSFALEPPLFLVALPQVLDPFFHRSVVLLLHHEDDGSFGLVVNRATGITVADILEGMEIPWAGDSDSPAHFGGPVQPQLGTVLFSGSVPEADDGSSAATEILPGLSMSQHIGDLTSMAAAPPAFFRLLLGYAGWGEGQLLEEIMRNDWLTAPAHPEMLLSTDVEDLWGAVLRTLGVDPATLPSWSPTGDDEASN